MDQPLNLALGAEQRPAPAAAEPAARAAPRSAAQGGLFRKYLLLFIGLVSTALLVNAAVDLAFTYRDSRAVLAQLQLEKVDVAKERIEQFIGDIRRQLEWTTTPQFAAQAPDQRHFQLLLLLRQVPAITEISQLDAEGREQVKVSRIALDAVGSQADFSDNPVFTEALAHKVWFSPVHFRMGSEPYLTLAIAGAGRRPGVTVAEVNLKLIWDVITAMKIGQAGYAYVVDRQGRLIAHPDMSLVLRDTSFSNLPQVATGLRELDSPRPEMGAPAIEPSFNGRRVLSAHTALPALGWLVFVELPMTEALAPLYSSALHTLLVLIGGLVLAALAAWFVVRRMMGPVHLLQAGAARIGAGDLDARIEVRTGDELETLANQFNSMAAQLHQSYAGLERKVEERTQELAHSVAEAERARAAAETALSDLRRAQDRLIQAEKMASLGQLTAGIAHEIKNPLNFVNNFSALSAELIDELSAVLANAAIDGPTRAEVEELGAMIKGNLEKVVQHGKRADGIVRNMLLHARESGGERRSVDLNATVDEALNLAYHGARAETPGFNITLERKFDPAVGALEIYPQEFTRVMLNLIGNGFYAATKRARDAGAGFEPTLTVATEARPGEVVIRVRDNGTGIPDGVKDRLFEPFFTTKPAGEGTGLGLSISHDIVVKQHGGSIAVESQPGAFTEFTVILPCAAA